MLESEGSTACIDSLMIPQANNLKAMVKALEGISKGLCSPFEIGEHIGYTERQGHYYCTALRVLNLIVYKKGNIEVTPRGNQLLTTPEKMKGEVLKQVIIRHPLISKIITYVEDQEKPFTKASIVDYLIQNTNLTPTTAKRRASTIFSWLSQLGITRQKKGFFISGI